MFERLRKTALERELRSNLPDVKFFGFGNDELPYRVGFDVDGYSKLLQETFEIDEMDASRITLRFYGFPQTEEEEKAIDEDIAHLDINRKGFLVREFPIGDELYAIGDLNGISLEDVDPDVIQNFMAQLLGRKLAHESVSIKAELLHEKFSRKLSVRVQKLLHSPIAGLAAFGAGEYLLQDFPWSVRTLSLIGGLVSTREVLRGIDIKVAMNQQRVIVDLMEQIRSAYMSNSDSVFALEQRFAELINVYPEPADSQ